MTLKNQKGFTLVELIVAIAVTGLMVIGVTNLYITIENTQRKSEHIEIATRAGERQIESLRNSNYGSLDVDTDIDFSSDLPESLPNPKTGIVEISEPVAGLKKVDLTITYKEGSADKEVKLSSMIGVLGIAQ